MDSNKDIKPLKRQFDFTDVPSWYVLCTNNQCPMQTSCLRFLAAQNAPDHLWLRMGGPFQQLLRGLRLSSLSLA